MANTAFDPSKRYVVASDGGAGKEIAADAQFWPDVMSGKHPELDRGWLVGAFPMSEDWKQWEMHPEGEEILTLLSGELEMIVEEGSARRTVRMRAGETFVMPRGAWHRALVEQPSLMFSVTYGR